MMNIKKLKQQVESIIGTSITEAKMDLPTWSSLVSEAGAPETGPICLKDRIIWLWNHQAKEVNVLETKAKGVTEAEVKLIHLLLSSARDQQPSAPVKHDDEYRSTQLGEWLQDRFSSGDLHMPVPDSMEIKPRLKGQMLPFLLSWDNAGLAIAFTKLNKLLKSYFGGDIVLIPLKEDWLILLGEGLFASLREESEEGAETERDLISALCQGLYELITNEWVGGFHLTVGDSWIDDAELVFAALFLRQTMQLGRVFDVTKQIHFPWELKLERLVYSIPEEQREYFIDETGDHASLLQDEELVTTLETFFQLDCNVSETAKRLYIHRNTLLYRIDKFKQETGLDVRTFRDAVLVKLELLLYKVTKRT